MIKYKINDVEFENNESNIFDLYGFGKTKLFITSNGSTAAMFHELINNQDPVKVEIKKGIYYAFMAEVETTFNQCDGSFYISLILITQKK